MVWETAIAQPDTLPKVLRRFLSKIRLSGSCIEWKGARSQLGYGNFHLSLGKGRVHRKTVKAHRLAYVLFKGLIPKGLQLDHLCRNPSCVNVDHLEPVTGLINVQRGKGATKQWCINGHRFDEENTCWLTKPNGRLHRRCRECRRQSMKGRPRWYSRNIRLALPLHRRRRRR
jgi:hypothetical protein